MDDHVVFFLGSGVSRPSGMPSVSDITQKVLDAPLVYTENKRYVFPDSVEDNPKIGRPSDLSSRHIAMLRGFLGEVRQHAQAVLCEDEEYHQQVTYEDLYALCGEIVTDQEGSGIASLNPATRHFSEALVRETDQFLLSDKNNFRSDLSHTANEANFLISGVVREMLSDSPDEIRGLEPLLAAVEELDRVTIVTLNHDLLVEQLLKEHDVDFDDGFGEKDSDVRRYSPERLFDGPNDVTLIKPHGSVNWYIDYEHSKYVAFPVNDPTPGLGKLRKLLKPEPSILSGYRKEEKYTSDIFGDMVDAFILALHDTSTVIESGFGWTDPGMVAHLCRYIEREKQNQLLLLHQEEDFSEYHPLSIPPGFHENGCFQNDGLIQNIQEYLSGTSWDDIKAHVDG